MSTISQYPNPCIHNQRDCYGLHCHIDKRCTECKDPAKQISNNAYKNAMCILEFSKGCANGVDGCSGITRKDSNKCCDCFMTTLYNLAVEYVYLEQSFCDSDANMADVPDNYKQLFRDAKREREKCCVDAYNLIAVVYSRRLYTKCIDYNELYGSDSAE